MREGKPTVHLDAKTDLTLTLDPSKYLQALNEAQVITAQYQLERGEDSPTREVSHGPDTTEPIREENDSDN